jgi:hypothetical protein
MAWSWAGCGAYRRCRRGRRRGRRDLARRIFLLDDQGDWNRWVLYRDNPDSRERARCDLEYQTV